MLTKIEHKFKNYFKQVTYKEVRERVSAWIPLIILYVFAGICILVMRKIQPDNKEYLIYVVWTVLICVCITFFVFVYGLQVQFH